MSGYTKHMYENDLSLTRKELTKYVKSIIPLLPIKYDFEEIWRLVRYYYPFEWNILEEKYQYYCKKDKVISKFNGKKRYNADKPEIILKRLSIVKELLDSKRVEEHQRNFSLERYDENKRILDKKRFPKIKKRQENIHKARERAQQVEPEFLNALMGFYDRKNATQKDKVYIFLELEKYYCAKTINFFKKIADSEYNRQLRNMAFYLLQSWGHYTYLRKQKYMQIHTKSKKRKQQIQDNAYEVYNVQSVPKELEYRIENSKDQKIKTYDYFISHSSKDHVIVQKLINLLNEKNKNVYCDWKADSDYLKRALVCDATKNVIKKRIEQSKQVIFVDSEDARKSCWVKYELNYAICCNKKIDFLDKNSIISGDITLTELKDNWFVDEQYEQILQL